MEKNGGKERMEKVDLLFNILVDITDMLNKSGSIQVYAILDLYRYYKYYMQIHAHSTNLFKYISKHTSEEFDSILCK